ncbi:MAG: S41 family peptidase [Desulfobacterales bacterium]|nr:S41 family peptidase [Desulfobacterales bacterium]
MKKSKLSSLKLTFLMSLAIFFSIVGTGSYRDSSAGSDETYKSLKIFSDVIEEIEKNYVDEVSTKDLIQKAIQGMVHSLDPHSSFMPPEAFEELQQDTKGEFGGIGIVISMKKDLLTVISPIEGTPAFKAGIKAGDIIIKVDGEPTKDMMLWEAVKKMRGEKGSNVLITVVRKGESDPLEFKLERDVIPLESVRYVMVKPGYGYIWITNFRESTVDDIEKALKEFESGKDPLKGLIIDLRDNPGGLLNQAVEVADIFLEKGAIVKIKGRLGKHTNVFNAHPDRIKRNYPIVVLINGGSASASEIVAGALQDHKRALILGTTSFGKGSVQTVKPLRDGYGLKFTIARYYTPNERSIQAEGIEPDIFVKPGAIKEPDEKKDDRILKEKDLDNHLEALPFEDKTKDKKEKKIKKDKKEDSDDEIKDDENDGEKELRRIDYVTGKIKVESLISDVQVKRALDILVSYEIFKNLKG